MGSMRRLPLITFVIGQVWSETTVEYLGPDVSQCIVIGVDDRGGALMLTRYEEDASAATIYVPEDVNRFYGKEVWRLVTP